MAEITYAGYIPTSRPDYSALSNDLAQKIYGVLDKRQERRTKLDEVEQANQKLLDSWIPGKTQTLNDFMLNGVDNMRKDLLQWNKDLKAGKMSESEYVRRNRNLEESYQMLANVLKSQDERVNTVMQRQEPDENGNVPASSYETDYLLKKFGEFSEGIKDKQIKTGSDGRVYLATVDPQTGLVTDKVMDVRSMALPENLAANRIDVPSRVEDITKNWSPDLIWKDLGLKGEENIETVKNKQGYKYMVEKAVNSIIPDSNPRAQVSVLVDNGVIDEPEYYDTEEERNQIVQEKAAELMQIKKESGFKGQAVFPTEEEMKNIEISLIKNVLTPDGVYMPELTEEQIKLAKERVRNEIDFSFSEKVTGTPMQPPTPKSNRGPGSPSSTSEDKQSTAKYKLIDAAWRKADFAKLNSYMPDGMRRDYIIGYGPGGKGYAVYSKNSLGEKDKIVYQNPSGYLDEEYLQYFFGNSASSLTQAEKQKKAFEQKTYGGGNRPATQGGNNTGRAPR
jgi:hypothetical protein